MILSNNNNYRCKYNGDMLALTNTRKNGTKHRGLDYADKSKQYYTSVALANTYAKTEYIKYNKQLVKLSQLLTTFKHTNRVNKRTNVNYKIEWYITRDRKLIYIKENGILTKYTISYTNGVLIKNRVDRKQQARIYQGK